MDDYIRGAIRRLFHRPRRLAALQPRLLPDRRPLCLRHVHRLDAADRSRRAIPRPSPPRASPASAARRTWARIARGRRHPSEPWLKAGAEADPDSPAPLRRGRKLVVQIGETFGDKNVAAVRREARCDRARREAQARSRAGHDLRRRRHAHRHRGGRRQPPAVPYDATSASRRSAALPATPTSDAARTAAWSSSCASAA